KIVKEATSPRRRPGAGPHARSKSEGEKPELPPSRAMTPAEQLDIIRSFEAVESMDEEGVSKRDLERYEYYISRGVPDHSLAAQDQEVMKRILQKRIPEKLTRNTELDPLITKLKQEVVGDYDFSLRKSIVDYILMDPGERQRLHIKEIQNPLSQRYSLNLSNLKRT
ncbi:dynein axonemal heavy chain 3-like, partial [Oculina patagonica]